MCLLCAKNCPECFNVVIPFINMTVHYYLHITDEGLRGREMKRMRYCGLGLPETEVRTL